MERRDFFISYTKRDKAWAVWVANVLKSCGYTVYMQEMDIKPGENFIERMNEFLKHSGSFIAVWSKAYSESRFCMTEMQAAFSEWHKKRMECFLIVCVDKHPVEPLYSALVHVDVPNKSAASEEKLADAVQSAVPPSAPKPEPPKPIGGRAQKFKWTGIVVTVLVTSLIIGYSYGFVRGLMGIYDANQLALVGRVYYERGDYDEARDYYEQAAEKGSSIGLIELGSLYRDGLGVDVDYAKARDYYKQAADKGSAAALYNLGYLYHKGVGVATDYARARDYYQRAVEKGDATALNQLGQLYHNGLGVATDYAKAREYYEQAAAKGYATALNNLGYLYHFGLGVDVDYAKARDYYEQAAAKGDKYGLYNLGWLYEHGQGVDVDYEKALDYYQKAANIDANVGNPTAAEKVTEVRAKLDESRGS